MTDWTVREATTRDVAGIRAVATATWGAAYGDLLRRETIDAALAEWYALDALRDLIEDPDTWCLVAQEGNELVGYASGSPVEADEDEATAPGRTARLGALYVAPDRQRVGIGTALLERFEAAARGAGCEAVRLRALSENDAGTAFYRARGFEAVRETSGTVFDEPVTETVFENRLD